MRIRKLTVGDAERVFDAFSSVAVLKGQENAPSYGFYDYPLSLEDFQSRLDNQFSIGLEEGNKLQAYILAYTFSQARSIPNDLVLSNLRGDLSLLYADQLFLQPGLPLYVAGRLTNTWTNLAFDCNVSGVVTAIPQKPWKNVASTRFVLARGFSRQGIVREGELELEIFATPLTRVGEKVRKVNLEIGGGR